MADDNTSEHVVPTDERFKPYRKHAVTWLRPHEVGEPLNTVSVSEADQAVINEPGGYIAINPANEGDKWYVSAAYFAANYVPLDRDEAIEDEEINEVLSDMNGLLTRFVAGSKIDKAEVEALLDKVRAADPS